MVIENQEYDVTKTIADGTTTLKITSPALEHELDYVITDDYVTATYNGQSNTVDITKEERKLRGVTYGREVHAKGDKRYYYCTGASGKKDYLKIGCKADYEIRTDNLSDDRKNKCNTYVDKINESNRLYASAEGHFGVEAVGAVIAVVGLSIVAPEVIVGILAGAGVTTASGEFGFYVNDLRNAGAALKEASDIYDTIKIYGTKL